MQEGLVDACVAGDLLHPGAVEARTATRRVERRTLRFDELTEAVRIKGCIQALIERMSAGPRQIIRRYPQSWCAPSILPTTHGHAAV